MGQTLRMPLMDFPCEAAPAGLPSLKPNISQSFAPHFLFDVCFLIVTLSFVAVPVWVWEMGWGLVLLCIFLLSWEGFHFLPRLPVLPSKGCSGQKTPPPLGVLSEPQKNRTHPQSASQLLRNRGEWWCGAGGGGGSN